ncbi:hypothetical protein BGX24_012156, partial [Mortierella sp. AD032]
GATSGFTSDLVVYPDYDLVIASTTNIVKVSEVADILPTVIAEILLDLPRSTIDWVEEIAVPAVKEYYSAVTLIAQGALLPPKIPNKPAMFANNLRAYVGEYSDPQFGSFFIGLETDNNKTTTLTYKYNELTSTLEHYHYDAFVATLDDPLLKYKALITFSADPVSGGDNDKKKRPITRMQIQELPAGVDISKKVFKKRRV